MNRNIVIPLICILVVAIAVLSVFLWQKVGDLHEVESQLTDTQQEVDNLEQALDESQQYAATLQGQLSESQQQVSGLQTQLAQIQQDMGDLQIQLGAAQNTVTTLETQLADSQATVQSLESQLDEAETTIADLQAELDELKSPPPPYTCGEEHFVAGNIVGHQVAREFVELSRFQVVQGYVHSQADFPMGFTVQDPTGTVVVNLGQVKISNFKFTAEMDGRYLMVVENPSDVTRGFHLGYTVCQKQETA